MGGLVFSGIGSIRDKANVAMTNLTYNIARTAQVFKYHRKLDNRLKSLCLVVNNNQSDTLSEKYQ